ncbi:hypothetical protein LTR95_011996 [Oleoguttula sp. CCFEE 5521]
MPSASPSGPEASTDVNPEAQTPYEKVPPKRAIPLERCQYLYLLPDTPKGRGVFASQPLKRGTHLETSPVLILPPSEVTTHTSKTLLNHYTYNWPLQVSPPTTTSPDAVMSRVAGSQVTQAIIFGLGSLFNHSSNPNVVWTRDLERECVVYKTLRDIAEGEELCISYGGPGRLTFVDVDYDPREAEAESWEDGLGKLGL